MAYARLKNRDEQQPEGAPAWMVTYGDMMGLLLCFFILLVSMSTVRDEKFRKLVESIHQAFGYELGAELSPGDLPRTSSLWDQVRLVDTPKGLPRVQGGSEVVNINGREFLCRTVREGRMITAGEATGAFAPGDAKLSAAMRADLDSLVAFVREYPNRLQVRGHAAARDAEGDEAWDLSFRRARAVGDYLELKGINPMRLRLSACGGAEPTDTNLTDEGRANNRRVEIVVSEELVENVIPRRPSHD